MTDRPDVQAQAMCRELRQEGYLVPYPVMVKAMQAAALRPEAQDGVAALVDATDYARNRLEKIASESWNGDGRDLKRSLQGVFAEYDAALRALSQGGK